MKILRPRMVYDKTGMSPSTVARKEKAGEFPKRVQIGPSAVGWLEHEVDAWIKARVAERDGAAA